MVLEKISPFGTYDEIGEIFLASRFAFGEPFGVLPAVELSEVISPRGK